MSGNSGQNYGQALPDQVERITNFVDSHLELIGDTREIYTARVALEREYAGKLQSLARKFSEKKAKMEASFVVGNEPNKSWDSTVLRQSTLNVAYDQIITSIVDSAQDHINLADELNLQVVEVLKGVERKSEETKKKELQFFQKLLAERDRIYADRLKSKQKYDDDCAEVESFRQKQGRASDDKHADRAAKQAEQQRNEMLSSKNVYLLSTSVANRTKAKFYEEDLPSLENELQAFQRRILESFIRILLHSQKLESSHIDSLNSHIVATEGRLNQVNVPKDQDLFIQYNVRPFIAPTDWKFEPCKIHYDTDVMSIEPAPKVFLQNKLRRCREKLHELTPLTNSKRIELNQLSSRVHSYSSDHAESDFDEVIDRYLEGGHQLAFYATSECILKAEVDTIVLSIGDDVGALSPHSFKSSLFSIPMQCGYCKSSIWGLSKQGKTCKTCGLAVHSKCELKVPANCQLADDDQCSMLSRQSTNVSRKNHHEPTPTITPSASSFVQPTIPKEPVNEQFDAVVIFDFTPTSEFELGVHDGMNVRILESDDGSGWVKVADRDGNSGLVPASYIQMVHGGSADTGKRLGSGERVRAIYPYIAQGPDELSLREGEIMELSSGQTEGNGWWEGYNSQGQKGIFPSNYVEIV
ncbi:hypothetical protein BYT27DRAFT_7205072 [Phlegmacium glaucopus]|nr:hypothetical protein BYT27DRAFT_7205072 [Phlegmacium glaucopus]